MQVQVEILTVALLQYGMDILRTPASLLAFVLQTVQEVASIQALKQVITGLASIRDVIRQRCTVLQHSGIAPMHWQACKLSDHRSYTS